MNVFPKVKPADLWYIIGYIAGDGNVSKDKRHIDITSKDIMQLELLKKTLYLTNKIGIKYRSTSKEKAYYRLQFGNVEFCKFLFGIGIKPNKSLTLGKIFVNNNYFDDFLRGVIDADGNISTWINKTNHSRQWCLRIYSASPVFIKWVDESIKNQFGVQGKLYTIEPKSKENCIFRLKYGKVEAQKLLRQVYRLGNLSLERKALQVKYLQNS